MLTKPIPGLYTANIIHVTKIDFSFFSYATLLSRINIVHKSGREERLQAEEPTGI